MSWATWTDFFVMGGYWLYVWGSYAVTAALISIEVALLSLRKRAIMGQLAGREVAHRP